MNKIELNHWYMKDNELSVALMRFYVSINILKNDRNVFFRLYVKGNDDADATINFYTIEDAISFTEGVIFKCHDIKEVIDSYVSMFEDDKFKGLNQDKVSNDTSTIELTPDEVDQAICEYFGGGKKYRVSSKEELSLNEGILDLRFYLIEHLNFDGVKKDIKTRLTEGDLKRALNNYVNFYDYELVDFKYIGGIHRAGYSFDEDTPHYDGINLTVKTKSKEKNKQYTL